VDPTPFAARVHRGRRGGEIVLSNGLISRTFRLRPNCATVSFDNHTNGEAVLRGVKPEAVVEVDGVTYDVGGLKGQPNYAYLLPEWIDGLTADPAALQFVDFEVGKPTDRIPWKRRRHHAPHLAWPPKGAYLRIDYQGHGVTVSVHYELYDGVPCLCKWITVRNDRDVPVRLNRFTCEILAAVEYSSAVEGHGTPCHPPNIHVETDYAMGGMTAATTGAFSVHWVPDPEYLTQVDYRRTNPCLLEVRPDLGPDAGIAPGDTFESFRAFVMPFDSYDRGRNGLAVRRMYRVVAPWVTENPLMMHVRNSDWDTVKRAIDQCAEVGFEMVILSFGSGFNMENDAPEYLHQMEEMADYARRKGIEIGGYSLLASRTIGEGNDVELPEGQAPRFGNSPCLQSEWGRAYFAKLRTFLGKTGFSLLEHDGSYPGDACQATHHPGHTGWDDSRWSQRRMIGEFYAWCRGNGIYLNVPDYYYLSGASKCGMGYREVNWSLPRDQQVIHTRQNIYDGAWQKIPTMGWMFVPLTEYHGGGAVATIEPLDEHLDHYERMLCSNLAMGVQACYRGPRLYDTQRTRMLVQKWVRWFKRYRDILESDLVHGRRADGRDIDWMLHVNPRLKQKGLLVVFNPLAEDVQRTLRVDLYYTGLTQRAAVREQEARAKIVTIEPDNTVELTATVPAKGMTWFVIE